LPNPQSTAEDRVKRLPASDSVLWILIPAMASFAFVLLFALTFSLDYFVLAVVSGVSAVHAHILRDGRHEPGRE